MSPRSARDVIPFPSGLRAKAPRDRWDLDSAPHGHIGRTVAGLHWAVVTAALPAAAAGLVVFGAGAMWIPASAILTAVIAQWAFNCLTLRQESIRDGHTVMIGLLLALTLPPTIRWYVPVVGAVLAVVIGKGVLGGFGNYLWHPALIGRIGVQILFRDALTPDRWCVLARGHLLGGHLNRAIQTASLPGVDQPGAPAALYTGWAQSAPLAGYEAWSMPRPVQQLGWLSQGRHELFEDGIHPMLALLRDHLPPWQDTLLGLTGGGLGEVCAIGLLLGALYLIYRGHTRWFLPVSILASAALAAMVLPVRIGPLGADGLPKPVWMPGFQWAEGIPVGLIYVLYQLTSGELMLGAVLFATDLVASPLTRRGQVIFGAGIGLLTIALRLYGLVPGACYWAILAMNTLVPLIDRQTQRRVYGT